MTLPILYSFRRCPYAIRARLALMHCGAQCELREIVLRDKPAHMLDVSTKGTVPILLLPMTGNGAAAAVANSTIYSEDINVNYRVLDESIDVMHWAMNENPTRHLQNANAWLTIQTMSSDEINALIEQNDVEFKDHLDKYKYSDRHPEHSQAFYFEQAMPFLEKLESILSQSPYLGGSQFRFLDAAILPFIRQFSMVEPKQFDALPLPKLQQWLAQELESELFVSVMQKIPLWNADSGNELVVLGSGSSDF